jgi:hypothetical protein
LRAEREVEIREADREILKALVGRRNARMATVDFTMVDLG